jgi:type VI secretion system secreted protein VgrG
LFNTDLTGQDLGTLVLMPGVYKFDSSAQLTGTLTLNGNGDSNARFDFQIGSTLTTASSSSILLINGAQAGNVFWQVGSSATLGTGTSFDGSILADQSITLNTGASMDGRALALNAAVTLDDNVITVPTEVPEPGSLWLLAFCASVFGAGQRLAGWRRKAGRS